MEMKISKEKIKIKNMGKDGVKMKFLKTNLGGQKIPSQPIGGGKIFVQAMRYLSF